MRKPLLGDMANLLLNRRIPGERGASLRNWYKKVLEFILGRN